MKIIIRKFKTLFRIIFPEKKMNIIQVEAFSTGHYYSVIPLIDDVKLINDKIFSRKDDLCGIDFDINRQIVFLEKFRTLFNEEPFVLSKQLRFDIENDSFSFDDAPILHYFLREVKPKKIIEIGSGNSSALMLDTNDLYLNKTIKDFTFIDIDLAMLKRNLLPNEETNYVLIEKPIQQVDINIFKKLTKDDFLFVDTSHVSKIGSDLHTILFKIVPILNSGVYIHFHDIRYPFEYTEDLVKNNVFWTEAYLLRAFLMYNKSFEICFWLNSIVNQNNTNIDLDFLPLSEWDRRFNGNNKDLRGAGGSIYLRKI